MLTFFFFLIVFFLKVLSLYAFSKLGFEKILIMMMMMMMSIRDGISTRGL